MTKAKSGLKIVTFCLNLPDCPAGTFFSGDALGNAICALCAKGSYSEGRAMMCTACDEGETTAGLGATSPDDCYPESEEGEHTVISPVKKKRNEKNYFGI